MAALEAAGVKVRSVENFTGLPEMLDGRVKTLHPKIHGGILARRADESHQRQMQQHRIEPIDLVVVNFYPFEKTVATSQRGSRRRDRKYRHRRTDAGARSGKKSCRCRGRRRCGRLRAIAAELDANQGAITADTRWRLARKAFARVTAYDAAISNYLGTHAGDGDESASARPSTLRSSASRRCATARIRIRPARCTAASSKSRISFTARNCRSTTSSISARR